MNALRGCSLSIIIGPLVGCIANTAAPATLLLLLCMTCAQTKKLVTFDIEFTALLSIVVVSCY